MPFSTAVWSWSSLFAILSKHYYPGIHCFSFSAVWSGSTLFAILSSLVRDYTICHSQQSDHGQGPHCHSQEQSAQGLHYLSFSKVWSGLHCLPFSAVWSTSTLFAILSSLIRVCSVCLSQQSDQGLNYLPFSAVWSGSTLFAILSQIRVYTISNSQQLDQGLHYLPFSLSSIIKVYTVCHSQQSDQGLHYLTSSAVWSRSRSTLSFSRTVWSGSILFAILSSLIMDYTFCHSPQQFDQVLHCLLFSAVWSWCTLFATLSSLIKIKVYTVILRNSLIRVYTVCHFQQQSDQGLHYLLFSAVWSGSTLFVMLRSSLIRVYTVVHSSEAV